MVVELISVGTELLLGNIVNTNAKYLSEECAILGLSMYYQTVVGDNFDRLSGVIRTAYERSDVIILTGGLGPTEDDLTKEACASVFGLPLVEDSHTRERLEEYFKNSIYQDIPQNNWKQTLVPEGAIVLDNGNGTAPGLIIEAGEKAAILLPGPPGELYPLFEQQVKPYLRKKRPETIFSTTVKICGMGESQVETEILDLIDGQTNPTIAPYAKTGEVHLRITASCENAIEAKKLIKPVIKELRRRFGAYIYSVKDQETLEQSVVKLLKKHDLTITTAESCTGGLLAGRIVNAAGASEVFKEGFITYSNKAKRKLLDVNKSTLKKYGAVSEQTAKEMAIGGIFAADADCSVAITGIAGPDGGTEEKPVGLVYIGCYVNEKVTVNRYQFKGNREKIREQAVVKGLDMLRRSILEYYND